MEIGPPGSPAVVISAAASPPADSRPPAGRTGKPADPRDPALLAGVRSDHVSEHVGGGTRRPRTGRSSNAG